MAPGTIHPKGGNVKGLSRFLQMAVAFVAGRLLMSGGAVLLWLDE